MKRRRTRAVTIWLAAIGGCASIAGGLVAANYAVGGIDPFYRDPPVPSWAREDRAAVAVVHDDDFLPSVGVAAPPHPAGPVAPARYTSTEAWDTIDARALADAERTSTLAEVPMPPYPDPAADPVEPKHKAPSPAPKPPPTTTDLRSRPVTPNDTLIY